MATQTLQRPQEFMDEGVHPLVEETQSAPTVEIVTYAPVPTTKDALLVRIARPILRFYYWLSGPPMTKRDRLNLYLESTAISTWIPVKISN